MFNRTAIAFSPSLLACIALLPLMLILPSCDDPEKDNPNIEANRELFNLMHTWYLWRDRIPPSVRVANYPSPKELMDAMRYKELDRWSYITTQKEHTEYFQNSGVVNFGMGLGFDQDENLWITFLYNQSPLREHGVGRGWIIKSIDGTAPIRSNLRELLGEDKEGVSKTFAVESPSGAAKTFTAEKVQITMNTVLMDSIYHNGSTAIGYLVLQNFTQGTFDELDEAFEGFLAANTQELIVDLRYNGGGMLSVSQHLASLIAGYRANGAIYTMFKHNEMVDSLDRSEYISLKSNTLDLDRVVFITAGGTASASEVLINGLKPHMPVTMVGRQTYGKPAGMYAFNSGVADWMYVPICFTLVNALGEGDYYDGLPVDIERQDGVAYPFGDTNEASLNGALMHLGVDVSKAAPAPKLYYPKQEGLKAKIGAW